MLIDRDYLSVGEVADALSVQSWRVARIYELGLLPEPQRIANRRMIHRTTIPQIADLLRQRGQLPPIQEPASC